MSSMASGSVFARAAFGARCFCLIVAGILVMSAHETFGAVADDVADLWTDVDEATLRVSGVREIVPKSYRTLKLDVQGMKRYLADAPVEFSESAVAKPWVLSLPMADGSFSRFAIVYSPIMEPGLESRYPEIRVYRGQGIDDRTASVRFDLTPHGFHAQVLRAGETIFIDPYAKGEIETYISYGRSALPPRGGFSCEIVEELGDKLLREVSGGIFDFAVPANDVSNGTTLRQYRLAVGATVEYTAFHGGTVALGLAAINTAMARVNGVYERDLAVRMNIVANNDLIVYAAEPDGYTNGSGSTMLGQNQTKLDNIIGPDNYDIGHVFSTGGGGVAQLGVVCNNNTKARGVTGRGSPIGDAFTIDYVAHEMGHQFQAQHTFNGTTGSCAGNRSSLSAYEPGSGSTIMAYAGICGEEDLQRNSDDYFHVKSLEAIVNFISSGVGSTCPATLPSGNALPTVSGGTDYTIPINTPFSLTAAGSDPDGDGVSYNWEQYNLGASGPINTDDGTRPIFRSFPSSVNPIRMFPQRNDILSGAVTPTFGEAWPTTNRTMTFQVTIRDNRSGGGAINTDTVLVTTTTGAGPFVVTQPNTNVSWPAGSTQTVTWNTANTNAAPVNAANVKILLSTDGGTTFPTVLHAATPNDGSENVTVPNLPGSSARILVQGADNVFFDISNSSFTITPPVTAPIAIIGRVVNSSGRGIANARIKVTSAVLATPIYATTNAFGYYRVATLPVFAAYTITPSHKNYSMVPTSVVHVYNGAQATLDFVGNL